MVGMILLRTVNRDVSRYNAIDLSDDIQEDFGWKLVHAEVFRQPQYPLLLSVANGSGAQLATMLGVSIFFALLGFLSPSNRGSLSTVMIVCWTLFGGNFFQRPPLFCAYGSLNFPCSCGRIRFYPLIRLSGRTSMEAEYFMDRDTVS